MPRPAYTDLFSHRLRRAHTRVGVYALDETGAAAAVAFCRETTALLLGDQIDLMEHASSIPGAHSAMSAASLRKRLMTAEHLGLIQSCSAVVMSARTLGEDTCQAHGRAIGTRVSRGTLLVLESPWLSRAAESCFREGLSETCPFGLAELHFAFAPSFGEGRMNAEEMVAQPRIVCSDREASLALAASLYAMGFAEVVPMLGMDYANTPLLQDVQTSMRRKVKAEPSGVAL